MQSYTNKTGDYLSQILDTTYCTYQKVDIYSFTDLLKHE